MQKVGIFAGSFDPVHDGHIALAKTAAEKCGLDKVFFLVEPRPRWKQGVRAYKHRINMVMLAIEEDPRFGLIELQQERFSVSETLPILKNMFKGADMAMLVGEDVLTHLVHWPHIEQLIDGVSFVIGIREQTEADVRDRIRQIEIIRGLTFHHEIFTTTASGSSSSSVRKALHSGKQPPDMSLRVLHYIRENKLYSSTGSE